MKLIFWLICFVTLNVLASCQSHRAQTPLTTVGFPSPNFNERQTEISMIILHYTGMKSEKEALQRLAAPDSGVSTHYLVANDGQVYKMVNENKRAWHAGAGSWQGFEDINSRSIGIEIDHPGHEWGYRKFSDAQIAKVIALISDIKSRYSIHPTKVLGHSDIAPDRKEDPGELFPWDRLADNGLAIGTYVGPPNERISYPEALGYLEKVGYNVSERGYAAAILAFQRRFCPSETGKALSPQTKAALKWAANAMQEIQ